MKGRENMTFSGDAKTGFFFGCKICNKMFLSTNLFKRHLCSNEINSVVNISDTEPNEEKDNKQKNSPKLKETIDTNGFNPLEQSVMEAPVKVISFPFNEEYDNKQTTFQCEFCDRGYESEEMLEKHKEEHKNEILIPCQDSGDCTEAFGTQKLLRRHMLEAHNFKHPPGLMPRIKCDECDYVGGKQDLKRHKLRHSNLKDFICQKCGKALKGPISLKNHMLLHQDTKDHKCTYCGKKYFTQGALSGHIKLKHELETFVCNVCGKEYNNKAYYTKHLTLHTGEKKYECREGGCEKRFRDYAVRERHERTHSGEKMFQCSECGKSFTQKDGLKQHKKNHDGNYEYKCDVCGATFNNRWGKNKCAHKIMK